MLAGAVAQRVVLHHANPRDSELPAVALKGLSSRTSVAVSSMIVDEILARKGVVGAFGFVEHRDVRLDPAVIHKPFSISAEPYPVSAINRSGHRSKRSCVRSIMVLAAVTSCRLTPKAAVVFMISERIACAGR